MEKAALICVTHNNWDKLKACLNTIYQNTDYPYHLFLIDNASTDETVGLYGMELENTTIIRNNKNLWWGGGINQGIKLSKDYDYVAFLNDDIELPKGWLSNHIEGLQDDKVGVIGPINSHNRDWQCYDRVRDTFKDLNLPELKNIDRHNLKDMNKEIQALNLYKLYVRGMIAFFCVVFRRDVLEQVGELDEEFIMGGDDDDYCRRLGEAGYSLTLLLNTYVIHHAGTSLNKMGNKYRGANMKRLKEKWPEYYGRA